MQTRSKLILASLLAALAMSLAAGSASATHLSLSHGSLWRAVFRPLRFRSGGVTAASCPVTLEGSFHSATISKVVGALIGYITGATVGACETGHATVLTATLPWHVTYEGFNEALPRPKPKLLLIGASFRVESFLVTCLTSTTTTNPAVAIAEPTYEAGGNGLMSGNALRAEEGAKIPCGGLNGEFAGAAAVTEVPGGAANLLVRLI